MMSVQCSTFVQANEWFELHSNDAVKSVHRHTDIQTKALEINLCFTKCIQFNKLASQVCEATWHIDTALASMSMCLCDVVYKPILTKLE